MYDAVVIGGGVVGSSTAYHLVCQGAKTLLIDREDAGRATNAGAGILSPETYYNDNTESWFNFAIEAVGYYPTLVERLRAEQAGETSYARCGKLLVAIDEDEIDALGLQLGPYSGKIIAELMVGKESQTDISTFDVTRFSATG